MRKHHFGRYDSKTFFSDILTPICDDEFDIHRISYEDQERILFGEFESLHKNAETNVEYLRDSAYAEDCFGNEKIFMIYSKTTGAIVSYFGIRFHPKNTIFEGENVMELTHFTLNGLFKSSEEIIDRPRLGYYLYRMFIDPLLVSACKGTGSIGYFVVCPNQDKLLEPYMKYCKLLNPMITRRLMCYLDENSAGRVIVYRQA